MKFSIVIPTYNRGEFISKVISSFLKQTYSNFELLIVDDGSTDNTEEIVCSFSDKRIKYFYKKNGERGAARNYGVRMATGAFINFFDSDDYPYPNHLEVSVNLLKKNDYKPVFFALNYQIEDETGKIVRKSPKFQNINIQIIKGNLLSCNGVFLKREIALQFPFSEIRELSGSEDYLLWLQLAARFKCFHSNLKTSAIVEHDERSVLKMDPDKIIKRKLLMLDLALRDKKILDFYGKKIKYLISNTYSYIALHLALGERKKEAIKYLSKAIFTNVEELFYRRTLAIIKHILF